MREISAEDLNKKLKENPDLFVINVLASKYYNDCHIKGSVNVPFDILEKISKNWDKSEEIVVYCAQEKCPVSRKAYALLESLGFTNLYEYSGGMKEWKKKAFDTEGLCMLDYLND